MKRVVQKPRADWQARVEALGFTFHTPNGVRYWDESASYRLPLAEVEALEQATAELQRLCLEAGQAVIDQNRFAQFGIPEWAVPAIKATWDAEPPAIYGRMDLAFNGDGPPKLLEYNADTPTSLFEAGVVQWHWAKDVAPGADQWNSIHERLVAKWVDLKPHLAPVLHFAHADDDLHEDLTTVTYLRDTASEAGLATVGVAMLEIGFDEERRTFVDLAEAPIGSVVKLYPWEWMVHEEFGPTVLEAVAEGRSQWMEPVWKMLWSNKALLAVLWELFPNHPNLLPAYLDAPGPLRSYARKPKLSREGANVTLVEDGREVAATAGDYGEEGFVYQALAPHAHCDGHHVVIGSWLVDGEPAGCGIREADGRVTDNLSRFVPHVIG